MSEQDSGHRLSKQKMLPFLKTNGIQLSFMYTASCSTNVDAVSDDTVGTMAFINHVHTLHHVQFIGKQLIILYVILLANVTSH